MQNYKKCLNCANEKKIVILQPPRAQVPQPCDIDKENK